MIRSLSDEYKKIGILNVQGEVIRFKFQHDRVQQAAYSLISEDARLKIHLQIGRLLAEDAKSSQTLDDRLFEIVSHLNQAIEIVDNVAERLSIARLNSTAGEKALLAAAYQASVEYFAHARHLLPEDGFLTHYELAFNIHLNLARSLYINGQFDQSVLLYPELIDHASCSMDEVQVRMVQMEDYHLQGDYDGAIEIQKIALKLLGEEFMEGNEAMESSIRAEMEQVPVNRKGRSYKELLEETDMEDMSVLSRLRTS